MRYWAWSYHKRSFQNGVYLSSIYLYVYITISTIKSMFFLFIRTLNNPMLFIITSHDEHVQTLIQ